MKMNNGKIFSVPRDSGNAMGSSSNLNDKGLSSFSALGKGRRVSGFMK